MPLLFFVCSSSTDFRERIMSVGRGSRESSAETVEGTDEQSMTTFPLPASESAMDRVRCWARFSERQYCPLNTLIPSHSQVFFTCENVFSVLC